ncbi:MAG: SDR family oxidoreductase [Trueperaceae bacterium]|nr:SDR family oxidoreductase [Trueperaceae bacterium]MCO5174914.1 SDR family oxidoreductase [Trueperaceae bacterium]MCW5821014.1 SDR family oxidoreductase [Trueperaceae bacterium]
MSSATGSGLLAGKVAVVTGASSGIGKAIAEDYAREGASVVVADVNDAAGEAVAAAITAAGGTASYRHSDAADPEAAEALVRFAVERYGALHVACNNAGIAGESNPTADYSVAGWHKVIDVNLNGVFYGMRAQIPAVLAAGGGAIVNVASILGQVGFAGAPAYVAAKHGVVGLSKNAAMEYAQAGVRVNVVGPGFIATPLLKDLGDDLLAAIAAMHPIGRLGTSEEVAGLVTFLSSDKASFVTGSYVAVDGGYLTR